MPYFYQIRIGIVCAALALNWSGLQAQQQALTLSEAVAAALGTNPDRQIARSSVDAARLGARTARTTLLPNLLFDESVTRGNDPVYVFGAKLRQQIFAQSDFAPNSLNRPTPLNNFSTRFAGNWTAFDSWHTQFEIRRADLLTRSASASASRSDQEILLRTIQAYETVLLSLRQIEVAKHDVDTATALLSSSQVRVESGLAIDADQLTANAYLAERQQELLAAQGAVEVAWAELQAAIGKSIPAEQRQLMPLREQTFADLPLAERLTMALKSRPDRQSLGLQHDAQRAAVQSAKSALGPQISAYGNWEMDKASFAGPGGNNWVAGAELRIDLLPAAKHQTLAAARIALNRSDAVQAAADREIELQVTRSYYEHRTASQMLLVAKTSVSQTEESLRILQERYTAGLATMTDLLRSEDADRQARASYWQAVFRNTLTYATLKFADGTLDQNTAGDLQ
jgi:outer membrane protein